MLPGRPELYLSKLLNNENRSRFFGAPLAVRARSGTTVRVLFPAKAELDEPESHVG